MPVLRAHGELSPTWSGYVNAAHDLSPTNDTSILDPEVNSRVQRGGAVYEGGLYVMGHMPLALWMVSISILIGIVGGMYLSISAHRGEIAQFFFPLGFLWTFGGLFVSMELPHYFPYKKFVVFDYNSGLVHIPRLLSGYDRIRFGDASFVLIQRIHYGGFRSSFYWYLYRPGMDLVRDLIPISPWRWLLELGFNKFDDETQKWWSFLVNFMNKDTLTVTIPELADTVESVRREARNPFKNLHAWQYRNFDPRKFSDHATPNWQRNEEGLWTRLEEHPLAWLCRPLRWLQIPAMLVMFFSLLSFLGVVRNFDWTALATTSAVFLGSLTVVLFYHLVRFDTRGSKGIPIYDRQGQPIGSMGIYHALKEWVSLDE